MKTALQRLSVSPRVGVLLSQVTETHDLETAIVKVLMEYLDLKIEQLRQQIQQFETKWRMTFQEFSAQPETPDLYSYKVESDFWEWEEAETLLKHYEKLQAQ